MEIKSRNYSQHKIPDTSQCREEFSVCFEDKTGWEVEGAVNVWLEYYGNIQALYKDEFCLAAEGHAVA